MNEAEQIEAIKLEAIAAADGGKGPGACKYRPGSDAERTWKDAFYVHYSLRPMTFAVRTLEIAGQYKPETKHMERSIASAEHVKSKILLMLADGPAISADIGTEIGYQRTTVKTLLRALVADGRVTMTLGRKASDPATYRLAES